MIKRSIGLVALVATVAVTVPLIGAPDATQASSVTAGRVHAQFQPTDGKIFVLVIGNDARSGNPNSSAPMPSTSPGSTRRACGEES